MMAPRDLPTLGPGCAARNPDLAKYFPTRAPLTSPQPLGSNGSGEKGRRMHDGESLFQSACERYLVFRGYRRLTADAVESEFASELGPSRGWFGHVARAKGNPLMPDLFVFRRSAPPLLMELKVREKYQRGQREMIEMGWWLLIRDFDEFVQALVDWESADWIVNQAGASVAG